MQLDNATISSLALHSVGNKQNDEPLNLSHELLQVSEEVKSLLKYYFLFPFKNEEFFQLYNENDLSMNPIYQYATNLFEDPADLLEQSLYITQHLYNQCTHPKIKSGEFYVVYFKGCIIDDEEVDAIGLFKAETKDSFIKVHQEEDKFIVESDYGFGINKLDKGCLIFNTEKEHGYLVAVVDNTNRNSEAQYWMDDFLHIRQRHDDFYNTQQVMTLCKNFVTKCLPEEVEDITKADQAELLNKSAEFFKQNDTFEMDQFKQEVIVHPEVIEKFDDFRDQFQQENEVILPENFNISEPAFKKQNRNFKSVIKLDKNFHIYVHGNTKLISKGFDEKSGMNYYQLFFNEEL